MCNIKKNYANIISFSRILFSFVLFFLPDLSIGLFVLYVICGLTDMIDGLIARKFDIASRKGAILDGVADITFVVFSGICLIRALYSVIPFTVIYPVAIIVAVKLFSYILGLIKFRRPCFFHTILNKISGGAVFLLFLFFNLNCFSVLIWCVCAIALTAAVEELVCTIKMKDFQPDIKGFFL